MLRKSHSSPQTTGTRLFRNFGSSAVAPCGLQMKRGGAPGQAHFPGCRGAGPCSNASTGRRCSRTPWECWASCDTRHHCPAISCSICRRTARVRGPWFWKWICWSACWPPSWSCLSWASPFRAPHGASTTAAPANLTDNHSTIDHTCHHNLPLLIFKF